MGLVRLLLLFMVIWLAYRLVDRWRKGRRGVTHARRPALDSEKTVRCDHCGTFVPESEAVRRGGRNYCSAAHRDADRR